MYSEAEMAAFAALLARALNNEIIYQDEVESVLPSDLFDMFLAYSIKRENALIDRHDEVVAEKWRNGAPDQVKRYNDELKQYQKLFADAPKKIAKAEASIRHLEREIMFQNQHLAKSKEQAWHCYDRQSATSKLLVKRNSARNGWPPLFEEKDPPMAVTLPGEELPEAYALRRLLSDIVGDKP